MALTDSGTYEIAAFCKQKKACKVQCQQQSSYTCIIPYVMCNPNQIAAVAIIGIQDGIVLAMLVFLHMSKQGQDLSIVRAGILLY